MEGLLTSLGTNCRVGHHRINVSCAILNACLLSELQHETHRPRTDSSALLLRFPTLILGEHTVLQTRCVSSSLCIEPPSADSLFRRPPRLPRYSLPTSQRLAVAQDRTMGGETEDSAGKQVVRPSRLGKLFALLCFAYVSELDIIRCVAASRWIAQGRSIVKAHII
jgi:hypothetical protein